MNNKAAVYISTFSDNKVGKNELNQQLNICKEYAQKSNLRIIEVIEQVGGNRVANDRPEVLHLLELCSTKKVGHVIMAERDKIYTEMFRRISLHDYLKAQDIKMHIVLDADVQEFLEKTVYPDMVLAIRSLGIE